MKRRRLASPPPPPPPVGCWVVFFIVLLGMVTLIVVMATYPYPNTQFFRESVLHGKTPSLRVNCTVGEFYDDTVDLCAPVMNTPIPISHEIMDPEVRQCDSFFKHMNGKWIKTHHNENRGFNYIHRRNLREIHDIIVDPRSGPVHAFYRSCVDTLVNGKHRLLDASQVKHVKEHVLGALRVHGDLPVVFARLAVYGFDVPFSFTIEPHPTELRMVPLIRSSPGAPQGAEGEERMSGTQSSLIRGVEGSPIGRREVGSPIGDLPLQIPNFYLRSALERLRSWATDESTDSMDFVDYVQSPRYTSDMTTMRTLLDASPRDFWKLYLRELNGYAMEEDLEFKDQPVWLMDPKYMTSLMHGLQELSIREWKAYVEWSIDRGTQDYFPELGSASYFRFRDVRRGLGGHFWPRSAAGAKVTPSSCIAATHRLLPGVLGNLYLQKRDHVKVRHQVTTVVERVRDALADMVGSTSWLSEATRSKTVEKLRAIIVRTVHPNYFEQEPFLDRLTPDNYLRNLNIVRRYSATRNLELWTKGTPNRDFIQRFGATLDNVNAFYSPVSNTITIFSGILNPPFYDPSFPDVALYAIIGMVAGHELAHAIDNTGRLFDKDGSLARSEPWTPEEYAEFVNRTDCMVQEFDAPFGCNNAEYGRQTLGEDMSDLIGVRAAYRAWGGSTRPRQEQRWFFQVFAQAWAEVWDQDELCERVGSDVHAIANYRVDKTLRQMVEFREAFGCREGDGMVNPQPCEIY